MDGRQLNAFKTVVEERSISSAAARLGYSQSAVTAQIKALEVSIGARLFDRQRDGVRLTAHGNQFLPYVIKILRLSEEAHLVCSRAGVESQVTLGASEFCATYRLPELVEFVNRREPGLHLSVRTFQDGPQSIMAALWSGDLDVVVSSMPGITRGPYHSLVLNREDLVMIASSDHPLARCQEVGVDRLRGTRTLVVRRTCTYAVMMESVLFGDGYEAALPPLQLGTIEGVKKAAVAGLGVALLPRAAIEDVHVSGDVVVLPWRGELTLPTVAVWRGRTGDAGLPEALLAAFAKNASALTPPAVAPVSPVLASA